MATISVLDSTGSTVAIEKPLTPGRAAAASSRPVALSSEDLAALTTIDGHVDGIEALIGTTNTTLTTIDGHVDGIETLIGTTNTTLTTIDGHVDGIETLLGTGATGLGKAEDAAHSSGDAGIMALSVRKDTAAATSGTDGDYQPVITDASGRLHVNPGRSTTIDDLADITLNNGSETSLVAVDTTRREAIIVADPANTVNIRIGKTGQVGAARGALLQPGQNITLNTTAAIYGFASAASQKVSITLLKD